MYVIIYSYLYRYIIIHYLIIKLNDQEKSVCGDNVIKEEK